MTEQQLKQLDKLLKQIQEQVKTQEINKQAMNTKHNEILMSVRKTQLMAEESLLLISEILKENTNA